MKKTLAICSILLVIMMFSGCTLFDRTPDTGQEPQSTPVVDLFNYDGLEYRQDQILVRTVPGVDLHKILAAENSEILKEWSQIGWALVSVPQGEEPTTFIKKLRKQQGVILAEPDLKYDLNTLPPTGERYGEQWGFTQINAEAGWNITTGSSNVIVAVVDTGVDMLHPEFADKSFIAPYDATTETEGPISDMDGHGTHVAGIAADNGRTGKIAGVAWDSPIMPVKVMDDNGGIYTSYLITAMVYIGEYVITYPDYRAVVNMSIGGRGYNFSFKDAIDFAASAGVLLVTAAGNDGKSVVSFPSAYNGVVSVAATTPYETAASFSTSGFFNSVGAPGTRILSTYTTAYMGEGYEYLDGTSMAAPFVTGAAALLLSTNPTLSPIEIKNQLEQSARGNGFTEALGYGVLDIQSLLTTTHPMTYGGLNVTSNLTQENVGDDLGRGVITVFDGNNILVSFGTTGQSGNHLFSALKAGTYTVNLSFYDKYKGEYEVLTQTAYVEAGRDAMIYFNVTVPTQVVKTLLSTQSFGDGVNPSYMTTFTVTTAGIYEFEVLEYLVACDPVLIIEDQYGTTIAVNDDAVDYYPYIVLQLGQGTYNITVSEFEELPVYGTLNIYRSEVVY